MTPAEPALRDYDRLTRDEQGAVLTVETATVRLAPPEPAGEVPTVDLIGVMHIADLGYYKLLDGGFGAYDAVLYEGIIARRKEPPSRGDKGALAVLVRGIARRLGLEYQLDCLDYRRPNFVHADMMLSEFRGSVRRRQESFLGASAAQVGVPEMKPQEADKAIADGMVEFCRQMVSDETPLALKRHYAEVLIGAVAGKMDSWFGPEGSTIGSKRNHIALRALKSQVKKGKRRLALLYGCAHMPDFERQLGELYGLRRAGERWLVAWDLRPHDADLAGFRS